MPVDREFLVLGPLEARLAGEVVPLGGGKRLAVLGMLLVRANEPVSTDWLIDALWGEQPPATARTMVQVYISQLRRLLADGILTGPAGYVLRVEPDRLDSARFELLAQEGRRALATGHAEQAAGLLRDALDLWRGPALADFAFEPWAQAEAGRLEELRLACVEERMDAELQLGHHSELVGELDALIAEHPLRERLRGQQMLALYRSGRQAEALEAYRQARETLVEELGVEPSAELRRLEAAILRQDDQLAAPSTPVPPHSQLAARPTNLPVQANRLIGRREELDEITGHFRTRGVRILTLTGPGGTGKTRLGLQAAAELIDSFEGGVYFVPLASVSDPALVVATVAKTLGVREEPGKSIAELLRERLATEERLLLLDNFEHVTQAAPELAAVLAGAPAASLLVTSRERLRIAGEQVFPVAGLPTPATGDPRHASAALDNDAVALFAERARAARADFELNDLNAAAVIDICARLDGLPLAIELAAARVAVLSPDAILKRLDHTLALLTTGTRDADARQQTLRSAIKWSYDLLDDEEQALFAGLSAFAGGCTLEAAEAVCDADLDTIQALVDKSLLRREDDPDGEPRVSMLETLREYALEQLQGSGEEEDVRRRHCVHFVTLSEKAESELTGPNQTTWLRRLGLEADNLRLAVAWSQEFDPSLNFRLATALWRFCLTRGHLREGRTWLETALDLAAGESPQARATALLQVATFANLQGDLEAMKHRSDEAIELFREVGDGAGVARGLGNLAFAAMSEGDLEHASALLDESATEARAAGDERELALTLMNSGDVAMARNDLTRAKALFTEGLAIVSRLQDADLMGFCLMNLGSTALLDGRNEEAFGLLQEALAIARELEDTQLTLLALVGAAAVVGERGDGSQAARLLAKAEALGEEIGYVPGLTDGFVLERARESVRKLNESELAAATLAGRGAALDDVLGELGVIPRS